MLDSKDAVLAKEAAQLADVSLTTLNLWVEEGLLSEHYYGGKFFYDKREVTDLVKFKSDHNNYNWKESWLELKQKDKNEVQVSVVETPFDTIKHIDENGQEYWSARELMPLLGYSTWQRFNETVERAKVACEKSGNIIDLYFINVDKQQTRGNRGATQDIQDYHLTKHACYLIAMEGDSRKEEVANAKTYFSSQTVYAEKVQSGAIQVPKTYQEALRTFAKMSLELADAIDKKIETEKHLAIAKPKADKYDEFLDADGYFTGSELARFFHKKFGIGRNKLYDMFRVENIFNKEYALPTQKMYDQHPEFFKLNMTKKTGRMYPTTLFSPKFVDWYIDKKGLIEQNP